MGIPQSVLEWLVAGEEPSVRYGALVDVLGYQVDLIEFVPSSVTPKNILLRAERTGQPRPHDRERAEQLGRQFGVRAPLASRGR